LQYVVTFREGQNKIDNERKGVISVCGKRRAIGIIILSFALGAFVSAVLPLWVLAVLEAIVLIIIGWCFFSGR